MQTTVTIASIFCYVFLVLQYKTSASRGAKDLTAVLIENGSLKLLNARNVKTGSIIFLCTVLYLISGQNNFFLFRWNESFSFITILLSGICLLISVYGTRSVSNTIAAGISLRERMGYFSFRIPGLIVYEIFFRAVLLGIFLEWFPTPIAVVLNIALYSLAHAFGSRKEFLGSIPFGVLLCFVTILNQSIYPSVMLHLVLALPYESILFSKCQLLTKKIES